MANKYLARDDAPFGAEVWDVLDNIIKTTATQLLAGRRLLHVDGPFGLGLKAIPLCDQETDSGLVISPVLPVALIQIEFALSKRDLAAYERDAVGFGAGVVAQAAAEVARMEDDLIFNGAPGLPGLLTADGAHKVKLSAWTETGVAADDLIKAATALDAAGFHGPYSLALAPKRYNLLLRRYHNGNMSELEHARTIATEGVFKAPILKDGGVLVATGRQYATIVLGQDMTVGFIGPGGTDIEFTISETLALRILQPKSICVLS